MFCHMSSSGMSTTSHAQHRGRVGLRRLILGGCMTLEAFLTLSTGYLLALLLAALGLSNKPSELPTSGPKVRLRLVVLVPAHDEQGGIQATLDSLACCSYPSEARRTVVI